LDGPPVQWRREITVESRFNQPLTVLFIRGDGDDFRVPHIGLVPQPPRHLIAVQLRPRQVQKHKIWAQVACRIETRRIVVREIHVVPRLLQEFAEAMGRVHVLINDQDTQWTFVAAQLLECACNSVVVSAQVNEAFAAKHLDEAIECGTQPSARLRRLYAYDWNIVAIGKRADMTQQVEHPHFVEVQVNDDQLEQPLAKGLLSLVERSYQRRAAISETLEQPIVKVGRCNKDVGG